VAASTTVAASPTVAARPADHSDPAHDSDPHAPAVTEQVRRWRAEIRAEADYEARKLHDAEDRRLANEARRAAHLEAQRLAAEQPPPF
jgi:primosomal protein N''